MGSNGKTICLYLLLVWLVNGVMLTTPTFIQETTIHKDGDGGGYRFKDNLTSYRSFKLLLHEADWLLLGGMNSIYNLSLNDLSENQRIEWPSLENEKMICLLKGKSEAECQNYIRVLVKTANETYLICGTNSYKPKCREYLIKNTGEYTVNKEYSGSGFCPMDPDHKSTAVYSDGALYAGTVSDFSGVDHLIYRDNLRTGSYNVNQLHNPVFVNSMDYEDQVLFFFREAAVGDVGCGERSVYSRVGRVCKEDRGGTRKFKHQWTSFVKSTLNCSFPGDTSFYFNEIQSTSEVVVGRYGSSESQKIVYGVFTTSSDSDSGSAVCAFSMKSLISTFRGPFKEQQNMYSNWLPVPEPQPGTCVNDSKIFTEQALNFVTRNPLKQEAVAPFLGAPQITKASSKHRFTSIAVDAQIQSTASKAYDVMFIGTDAGRVIKAVNTRAPEGGVSTVVIEDIQVLQPGTLITNMQLVRRPEKETKLVIISEEEVVAVPIQRCHQYAKTCRECIHLQDPHCAWNLENNSCDPVGSPYDSLKEIYLQEIEKGHTSKCPPDTKQEPLQWITTAQEVDANQNTSVTLECELTDSKPIKWTHNGKPLSDQKRISISESGSKSTISVDHVQVDDSGTYGCHVDELPKLQHTLNIFGWTTDRIVKGVPVGASFSLQCQLSESGVVTWIQNSDLLGYDDAIVDAKKNDRYLLSNIDQSSHFTVINAQKQDSGIYTCKATGIPDLTHVISVLDAPLLEVTCTGMTASLRWKIDRLSDDLKEQVMNEIIIQRSWSQADTWETLKRISGKSTNTTVNLITRSQRFRMIWKDSLGIQWISNSSHEQECVAPEHVPLSNPNNVHAFLLEEEERIKLKVYWSKLSQDLWMGPGFHYLLKYKEENSEVWNEMKISCPYQHTYEVEVHSNEPQVYLVMVQSGNDLGVSRANPVLVHAKVFSESISRHIPDNTSDLQRIAAGIGEDVVLKCNHEIQRDFAFSWFKIHSTTPLVVMGHLITSDYRFSLEGTNLKIKDLTAADFGAYACEVKLNDTNSVLQYAMVGDTLDVTQVNVVCSENEALVSWNYCLGEYKQKSPHHSSSYNHSEGDNTLLFHESQQYYTWECVSYEGLDDSVERQLQPFAFTVKSQTKHGEEIYATANTTSAQIKLRPGNMYTIAVSTRNIYGDSSYKEALEKCVTKESVPWRNPNHVTLSRDTTSIIVFWELLEQYEYHGEGFSYNVTYSTGNSSYTSNVESSGFKIRDIEPELTYTITVTSFNRNGECYEPANPVTSYPVTSYPAKD